MKRRTLPLVMVGILMSIVPVAGQPPQRPVGVSKSQLADLIPVHVVPGFSVLKDTVDLDFQRFSPGLQSSVERLWTNDAKQYIEIKLDEFDTAKNAVLGFDSIVQQSSGLVAATTPEGLVFGEQCRANSSGGLIFFRLGRVLVTVNFLGEEPVAKERAANLAYAMEYRLRHSRLRLEIPAQETVPLSAPGTRTRITLTRDGVALAPISVLEAAGVKVASENDGPAITLTFRDRTLRLHPLSNQAILRRVSAPPENRTLGAPVFVNGEQTVIPLEAVAEALGLTVVRSGSGRLRPIKLTVPEA